MFEIIAREASSLKIQSCLLCVGDSIAVYVYSGELRMRLLEYRLIRFASNEQPLPDEGKDK